ARREEQARLAGAAVALERDERRPPPLERGGERVADRHHGVRLTDERRLDVLRLDALQRGRGGLVEGRREVDDRAAVVAGEVGAARHPRDGTERVPAPAAGAPGARVLEGADRARLDRRVHGRRIARPPGGRATPTRRRCDENYVRVRSIPTLRLVGELRRSIR